MQGPGLQENKAAFQVVACPRIPKSAERQAWTTAGFFPRRQRLPGARHCPARPSSCPSQRLPPQCPIMPMQVRCEMCASETVSRPGLQAEPACRHFRCSSLQKHPQAHIAGRPACGSLLCRPRCGTAPKKERPTRGCSRNHPCRCARKKLSQMRAVQSIQARP